MAALGGRSGDDDPQTLIECRADSRAPAEGARDRADTGIVASRP